MQRIRSIDDKKRQRKSSDSEPTPAAKQTKMAGVPKNDLQTILKAVQDLQSGQESLKAFFDK